MMIFVEQRTPPVHKEKRRGTRKRNYFKAIFKIQDVEQEER
jgi:hypothetical protein